MRPSRALEWMVVLALSSCVALPRAAERPMPRTPWWNGAVIYEIFVRSFQDSNGDGIGDLRGLTSRLDYLNDGDPTTSTDLGVDALWLTPIFPSPSYHGYDTTDYTTINPVYGTMADFDTLVAEAHKRGIRIILDLALNHTSNQHPWFQASSPSDKSTYRDWYIWRADDPGWSQPWNASSKVWHALGGQYYYGLFWSGMPDLNFRNPAVVAEMTTIAAAWAKRGVDGFRLDSVRHLVETGPGKGQAGNPETHQVLQNFRKALWLTSKTFALVGEVWSNSQDITEYFGDGTNELQVLLDFPLARALVDAGWSGDATEIVQALKDTQNYPAGAVNAPFLTNHDMTRVATALRGDRKRMALVAAILLTLPGAPFVYYGEEIGLPNGPGSDDEWKRTPMVWDNSPNAGFTTGTPWKVAAPSQQTPPVSVQKREPDSILSKYRAFIALRHASPALAYGKLELLETGNPAVLAFVRRDGPNADVVIHNLGSTDAMATLKLPKTQVEVLYADTGSTVTPTVDGWHVAISPMATSVVRMR